MFNLLSINFAYQPVVLRHQTFTRSSAPKLRWDFIPLDSPQSWQQIDASVVGTSYFVMFGGVAGVK